MALMGEKAARNERDKVIALQAAEAALVDAELDIENATASTSRSAIFSPHSAQGFSDGCGTDDDNLYQGLCTSPEGQSAAWLTAAIADASSHSPSVKFGRFTGQTMPHGGGSLPSELPRYIIELMPDNAAGQTANGAYMYRVTAIGFGSNRDTQAVVQSFYRKSSR
jgi:type IV pilus assembly protein PilX